MRSRLNKVSMTVKAPFHTLGKKPVTIPGSQLGSQQDVSFSSIDNKAGPKGPALLFAHIEAGIEI